MPLRRSTTQAVRWEPEIDRQDYSMKSKQASRLLQVVLLVLAATLLISAGPSDETRINTLGHQMMCMCGCNQILAECNHVGCSYSTRMMGEIRQAVARGDSDAMIKKAMVEEYGSVVLAAPTTKGFDIVAWIIPFVILVLAMGAFAWVVRTWKNRKPPDPPAPPSATNEMDSYRELARKETEL